jgi:hypothetical protein
VIGDVNEESCNSGWKLLASDGARFGILFGGEGANTKCVSGE